MRKTTRPIPTITEDLETLKQRLVQTRQAILKLRLHLLILLKSNPNMTRQRAADHLALHRNTVARWLRLYQQDGLDALLTTRPVGAPAGQKSLPPEVLAQLQARLKTLEGFTSYGHVQQWIHQEFDLAIAYPTLHNIIRYQLKAKLKRARPSHAKKTSR